MRRAANESARRHLPGDGWCFFDVRHDFPDAWELLRTPAHDKKHRKQLSLRLTRRMFPYIPGCPEVLIDKITLLFGARGPEHKCCEVGECACLERKPRDSYEIGLVIRPERDGGREHDRVEASCVSSGGCPDLYIGNFDIATAPTVGEVTAKFDFTHEIEDVSRVYMFCHYTLSGNLD